MKSESLNPFSFDCLLTLSYVEATRGPLGEVLPGEEVIVARIMSRMDSVSTRKVRTMDQQQVVETCLFTTWPRKDVQPGWRVATADGVYTVRNVDRSRGDRIVITGEADVYHDRAGS
ncbi:head-tail adaptor protein [Salmonella enterica]|uniref:head-tail adaptor protein n=1 Tax=Salmonella enterica TaxID=28901 RepID=UPI0008A81708|nr:head-tail adaptor protein [Salmonella enterica]EAA9301831.1 head-tail adaptor protein [Salmonella enterica]EAA9598860.1 head-tail adaptor protein [Salmonella enterica]EAO9640100.1 head-tail adaptor protein [Salmonella enterica]EHR6916896.1 head-tail adaptor protein [Salmonella enterica]EHR8817298.1 head-tail adaptor protein [Salmonella enterica]